MLFDFADFRGENKIAFRQSADFVRPDFNVHFAPGEANVRMMSLLFRNRADFVHESERAFEIGKFKLPPQLFFFRDVPTGVAQFVHHVAQRIAFERGRAAVT